MRKSIICACILSTLISRNSAEQSQHESKSSGIIHLSATNHSDIASCHVCIVRAVGITQILLMKSDTHNRIYWIEGTTNIARAFVMNCNNFFLCAISIESSESYNLDYFFVTGRRESNTVIRPAAENYVEESIFQWSKIVISEMYGSQTAELEVYPKEAHQEHQPYLRKQPRILQALFFNEIEKEPIIRAKDDDSNKALTEASEPRTDLSIRCIINFKRKKRSCMS